MERHLIPIRDCDVGVQVDMFGNESIHITRPNTITMKPTLDDLLKETKLLKTLKA